MLLRKRKTGNDVLVCRGVHSNHRRITKRAVACNFLARTGVDWWTLLEDGIGVPDGELLLESIVTPILSYNRAFGSVVFSSWVARYCHWLICDELAADGCIEALPSRVARPAIFTGYL